jgi:hypothetical protein
LVAGERSSSKELMFYVQLAIEPEDGERVRIGPIGVVAVGA